MMYGPARPRSGKQRLADSRLAVKRGPSPGLDGPSRDPFAVGAPKKKRTNSAPKFTRKTPMFGARSSGGRALGRY